MPSAFRTAVKSKVKSGLSRLEALKTAKESLSTPLTSRQQKRYDRGVKKLTPSPVTPGTPTSTPPSPTTPPAKKSRPQVRLERKQKRFA